MNGFMLRAATTVVPTLVLALALSSSATPTPPGRNGLIAFATYEGIAVIRPDGSGLRKVTKNIGDRSPTWSPDGQLLAFERRGHIYVIKVDGTGLKRLTSRRSVVHEPAWSPGGRYIAFVTEGSLFFMRADGSGVRRLYRAEGDGFIARRSWFVAGPSWSPDGRWIAFTLAVDDGGTPAFGSILIVNRDGSRVRYVTDGSGYPAGPINPVEDAEDYDPDWSPDGTRIAFTRVVWLCDKCDQKEIFATNVAGSDVRWVTTDTSFEASKPSWSPDGKKLVAETSEGIAILSLAGRRLRTLPRGTEPAWQPR